MEDGVRTCGITSPAVEPKHHHTEDSNKGETVICISNHSHRPSRDIDAHKTHSKHDTNPGLLPRAQIQLQNLIDRHQHHDGVDADVDERVGKCRRHKVDALAGLLARPAGPREPRRHAAQRVGEDPGHGDGGVQADDDEGGDAEEARLEDAEQEETDGDFGEGDLRFVQEDEAVEALGSLASLGNEWSTGRRTL